MRANVLGKLAANIAGQPTLEYHRTLCGVLSLKNRHAVGGQLDRGCLRVRRDGGSNLPKGFDDHEQNDGSDGRLDDGAD